MHALLGGVVFGLPCVACWAEFCALHARSQALQESRLGSLVILGARLCHSVLKLACNDNADNQAYVAQYSDLVMSHLTCPVDAPDTLAAMYANNMAQLQTVTPEVVKATVDLIRFQGRSPRYMNFLRQMCGTGERPMPSNQVRVHMQHKSAVCVSSSDTVC